MFSAIILAAITPQARIDRIADHLRSANPVLCGNGSCPAPVAADTPGCGHAKGFTVKIDPGCLARLTDDEAAFVLAHEWGHVSSGTRDEQVADGFAWVVVANAGLNPRSASQVFLTMKAPHRLARITGEE